MLRYREYPYDTIQGAIEWDEKRSTLLRIQKLLGKDYHIDCIRYDRLYKDILYISKHNENLNVLIPGEIIIKTNSDTIQVLEKETYNERFIEE